MKGTRSPIWLDIETGGLDPSKSSILTIAQSIGGNPSDIRTTFAHPQAGTFLSSFSEKTILPQLKTAFTEGKSLLSERSAIESLISNLEKNPESPIAGFNIRGFDIGFIQRRARTYGLEKRFLQATKNREIIDPVHQIKDIVASSISLHADIGTFRESLGNKTWSQAEEAFSDLPFQQRPPEYNLISQVKGYLHTDRESAMFKGWKLEDLNKILSNATGVSFQGAAHEAVTDIQMTQRLSEAVRSGTLGQVLARPEAAKQWMSIVKERGFHQQAAGRLLTQADIQGLGLTRKSKLVNWAVNNPGKVAGIGIAGILAYSAFSAKDDNYNTIEGLPHGAFAQSKRLELTDFGSGYRGIIKIGKEITSKIPREKLGILAQPAAFQTDIGILKTIASEIESITKVKSVDLIKSISEAEEAGHRNLLVVLEENLHNQAKLFNKSPAQALKEMIRHENVHLGARQKYGEKYLSESFIDDFVTRKSIDFDTTGNLEEQYRNAFFNGLEQEFGANPKSTEAAIQYLSIAGYNSGNHKTYFEEKIAFGIQASNKRVGAKSSVFGRILTASPSAEAATSRELSSLNPNQDLGELALEEIKNNLNELHTSLFMPLSEKEYQIGLELENLGSSSRRQLARNWKAKSRITVPSSREAHNTIEGMSENSPMTTKLRKLSGFGSPANLNQITRRAERLYKSLVKTTIRESGYTGKIKWSIGSGAVNNEVNLVALGEKGEALMGVSRSFHPDKVYLGNIDIHESLRGGAGSKFYKLESNLLRRIGFAGKSTESVTVNPMTAAMQSRIYNARPNQFAMMDIKNLFGMNTEEFLQGVKNKRWTKHDWDLVSLGPTMEGRIPGRDDAYNSIEGLPHGTLSQRLRKLLTPFGSGWNPLRNLLKGKETLSTLFKSRGFQQALQKAETLSELGAGTFGTASLMKGKFRGKEFSFVRKIGDIQEQEAEIMSKFSDTFAPHVYRTGETGGKKYLDMELLEGSDFYRASETGQLTGEHWRKATEHMLETHAKGYSHSDLHAGNLILTKEGQVGVIDWGAAGEIGSEVKLNQGLSSVTIKTEGGKNLNYRSTSHDVWMIRSAAEDLANSSSDIEEIIRASQPRTDIARKKVSVANLNRSASATSWIAGKNGSRRSKL